MKDWIGNKNSIFKILAANNHSDTVREKNDYYATDPKALELFLDKLKEDGIKLHENIWECACGEGNLSQVLVNRGYGVTSSDLINRGYGMVQNFLEIEFSNNYIEYLDIDNPYKLKRIKGRKDYIKVDILTNPPYKQALEFVKHALEIISDDFYAIFFLKIQFLEGKERYKFFKENPPKYVYVHSERQKCALNNNFNNIKSSAVCYAWFIWQKGYKGDTIIRWI